LDGSLWILEERKSHETLVGEPEARAGLGLPRSTINGGEVQGERRGAVGVDGENLMFLIGRIQWI
jgi:hypothetical protein